MVRRRFGNRGSVGEGLLSFSAETLQQISAEVGTPTYVYDAEAIEAQYRELTAAFAGVPHRIFYSVKSNSNLAILRLLKNLGAGADIVSGGEQARTRAAGIPSSDVVFSGVGKTRSELAEAISAGVGLINVESSGEVEQLGRIAEQMGAVANCGIRVNPDVTTDTHPYTQTGEHGMKFGVPADELLSIALHISGHPHLVLLGVGMHIGSQITNPANYRDGSEKLAALFSAVVDAGVDTVQWLGIGGGMGIRYMNERSLPANEFAAAVRSLYESFGLSLALEPGRYLVGAAGCLLTECVYVKRSGNRNFAIVDAGMNDLLRPSLYGAEHDICVVQEGEQADGRGGSAGRYDVVGPICESGDFLGRDRDLGTVTPGALLAVLGAGAYGFSMSSNYNSRPRAAEVLVEGARWRVIRQRETTDDLMRGEDLADPC
jgi:diaminopimelate decarboxylase